MGEPRDDARRWLTGALTRAAPTARSNREIAEAILNAVEVEVFWGRVVIRLPAIGPYIDGDDRDG